MNLIPAVDLLDGKVVRLYKGDFSKVKVYSFDPMEIAKKFYDMGVQRLHIVDLNGAQDGSTQNFKVIESIAGLTDLKIQAGGGIRNAERVKSCLSAGVSYPIIGTLAIKDIDSTKDIIDDNKGVIILGLDALNGKVHTDGWLSSSSLTVKELIDIYRDSNIESIVYTDISKDGTLSGLNFDSLKDIAEFSPFNIIASGGVSSSADIDMLCRLNKDIITGCIIGKAFYEGLIDLKSEISRFKDRKYA